MALNELFWKTSENDRKKGYLRIENGFLCLLCGAAAEQGVIYNNGGVLCDAEMHIRLHIQKEHSCVFEHLIGLDKRLTGLSDHQRSLMKLFYEGASDAEIQKKLSIGSASTIRQHRFALKEKERQAKIFTVLIDLLNENESNKEKRLLSKNGGEKISEKISRSHKSGGAAMELNKEASGEISERENIIKKYFPENYFGRLKSLTMKEKSRIIILTHIAGNFKPGIKYNEKEVNSILSEIYDDYVTLKRYLIDYGFMDRKPDGSLYWLTKQNEKKGEKIMEPKKEPKVESGIELKKESEAIPETGSKKEMKRQYKEMKQEGGVYQIRNTVNKKILLLATPDLKTVNGKLMQLRMGSYPNAELQNDWNRYGEGSFVIEVIEAVNKDDENFRNKLEKIEKKWFEKLDPFGEKGYNAPGRRY